MKRRILSALMALAMVAGLMTGCSAPAAGDNSSSEGTSQAELAPVSKDEIKVGFVYISDSSDMGYTYNHELGTKEMQEALGLRDDQIISKYNVPEGAECDTALRELAESGCNIIFATSFGYEDYVKEVAAEYPNIQFCHATGYQAASSGLSNFHNYFASIYEARYLAGIAAGLKTETNKIGYVAAMDKENAEVTGGCNAFAMGVASVNPDAEVYVKVTGSWFSPDGEKQAADALIAEGCDVIGQHCDTPNPQLSAEAAGVWGVGYNSDMSKDAPNAVLTSTMWDWSVYYTKATQAVIDGTWDGSNYFGGMDDGLVLYAPLSDLCAEGTAEAIQAAQDRIISGEWDVFTGPIEDNEGNIICAEGEKLSDADITGNIHWYYKNVTVK